MGNKESAMFTNFFVKDIPKYAIMSWVKQIRLSVISGTLTEFFIAETRKNGMFSHCNSPQSEVHCTYNVA